MRDPAEVCPLSRGMTSAHCLNPYPPHYRPAFASSAFLCPHPHQLPRGRPASNRRENGLTVFRPSDFTRGKGPPIRRWFIRPCGPSVEGANPVHVARVFSEPFHHAPFWFKPVSIFGLFYLTTVATVHISLTMPRGLAPNPIDAEFSSRSHDLRYATIGEGTLSRQLHTTPLPAPHGPVGYR